MKSFRTLRGFVEGSEPDEPNYLGYSAHLRIFGDALDLDEITRTMGVQPTVAYRKGEQLVGAGRLRRFRGNASGPAIRG